MQEYIQAGDIFQLVLSQRFERDTRADPFEIYRSVAAAQCIAPLFLPTARIRKWEAGQPSFRTSAAL